MCASSEYGPTLGRPPRLCMKASYPGWSCAAIWSRLGTSAMRAMEPPGRWTVARLYSLTMTRHFGVLIPSTNTTVETECRLLPPTYQAHVGRLMSNGGSFSPGRDEDVVTRRMSAGACVPAITSAQAVGRAVRALGARRVAIVSPYSEAVNQRAGRYFATKHGLDTIALEGFGATDAYAIGKLGPQNARDAFARIDRPEIEVFVVPGGTFPTMLSIASWEREFEKPVVTTNQASFWAMLRAFNSAEPLPAFGRLLAELPADASSTAR